MQKHGILLLPALVLLGCAKLTEPPADEAIQAEPKAAEPKAAGSASAAPRAGQPQLQAQPFEVARAQALGKTAEPAKSADAPPPPVNEKLEMKDVTVGKGAEAKPGMHVKVHYVGTLTDGKEFDASRPRGKPFEFDLGGGQVIKGWDQGVAGMKVGGKRKLTIPPSLGYGARGVPPQIPGNSTLLFEVELLEVKKK